MNRTYLALGFAALSVLFAAPAAAGVDATLSEGSRWDVRGWCAVHGGVLREGVDSTTCASATVPGLTFTCDDAGACSRTGLDPIKTGGTTHAPAATESAPVRLQDVVPSNDDVPYHYLD